METETKTQRCKEKLSVTTAEGAAKVVQEFEQVVKNKKN